MARAKVKRGRKRLAQNSAKRQATAASARAAGADASPVSAESLEKVNRERAALERAIRIGREKTLGEYRTRLVKFEAQREGTPKWIFAEGDSWFKYPPGRAIVTQLQALLGVPIANLAWPGAEARQLLALHEREEIEKRLTDGPERGKKWDMLLFSGGGDDIVGDQMVLFLNRYNPNDPPQAVLNARFNEVLDLVMGAYRDLIALRDAVSPHTLIIGHVYDYAFPTGKGVCGVGPWLRPSLDYARVPRGDLQHKVLIEMLKRFEVELQKVAAASQNFIIVPTHGTLPNVSEWANELHPKDPGFHQLALKFQAALQPRLA